MLTQKVTIALVQKAAIDREGMKLLLNSFEAYNVSIEAKDLGCLKSQLQIKQTPELFVINFEEFDKCTETLAWLTLQYRAVPVIIISSVNAEWVLVNLLSGGARAFLKRSLEKAEWMKAFDGVMNDGYYYNNPFTRKVFSLLYQQTSNLKHIKKMQLTGKECQLLKLISTDLTYSQIATAMQLSPRAINKIRDELFRKLSVCSRQTLSSMAADNGFAEVRA